MPSFVSTSSRLLRPRVLTHQLLAVALGASLAGGCVVVTGGGGDTDDTAGADETGTATGGDPIAPEQALRECGGDADIADQTVIVADYDQSIHEMVACGGLTVTLVAAITSGIIDAVIDNRSDATPEGWEFREGGEYYTNSAAAEMTATFYLGQDFEFGREGDVLTENLFEVGTYLTGARVVTEFDESNPLDSRIELRFDGTGPYVELLGLGPNPQSPIEIGTNTWGQITSNLEAIVFDSEITVNDMQSKSTIRYDVSSEKMPASELLGGGMGYALEMADGSRADLGQNLIIEDWGIEFVDQSPGALDGEVVFRVEGGAFDFEGTMVYDASTYGEAHLRCPQ